MKITRDELESLVKYIDLLSDDGVKDDNLFKIRYAFKEMLRTESVDFDIKGLPVKKVKSEEERTPEEIQEAIDVVNTWEFLSKEETEYVIKCLKRGEKNKYHSIQAVLNNRAKHGPVGYDREFKFYLTKHPIPEVEIEEFKKLYHTAFLRFVEKKHPKLIGEEIKEEPVKEEKSQEIEKEKPKTVEKPKIVIYKYEDEDFMYRNGSWYYKNGIKAPDGIVQDLNKLLLQDEDLSSKSIDELMKIADQAKVRENTSLVYQALKEAENKANVNELRRVLPRLSSYYRNCGMSKRAITEMEHYIDTYGNAVLSPALMTSLGAAYCDEEEYEKSRECANRARGMSGNNASMELISLYARLKSKE